MKEEVLSNNYDRKTEGKRVEAVVGQSCGNAAQIPSWVIRDMSTGEQ